MSELLLIFLAAGLANNVVVDYLLGVSPLMAAAEKIEIAIDMALAVTYVLTVVAFITCLLDLLIISTFQLEAYRLVILVMTVTGTCLLSKKTLSHISPGLSDRTGRFYPLFMLNCTLLGVTLINVQQENGLFGSIFFGLGAGAGFALILLGFTTINARLSGSDLPASFKGLSIQMITLGIISMAFSGFPGL